MRRKLTRSSDPALYAAIKSLERLIEHAIDDLDKLRGDIDLEADQDLEPTLGWPEPGAQALAHGVDLED